MGRGKSNAKQKSSTPILLPHDGILYSLEVKQRHDDPSGLDSTGTSSDATCHDRSISFAKSILQRSRDISYLVDDDDEVVDDRRTAREDTAITRINMLAFTLCSRLIIRPTVDNNTPRTTTTTKDQLQALQSFRERFLNWTKKMSSNNHNLTLAEDDNVVFVMTGLYRLLLEWSLSYQTPFTFQRAIQSNLKTIKDFLESIPRNDDEPSKIEDTSVRIEDVDRAVLHSVLEQPECWKEPLHSLDVAVNYQPLREILQRQLLLRCLDFLCHFSIVDYIASKRVGTNNISSRADVITLQPGEIDEALNVATILKILLCSDSKINIEEEYDDERLFANNNKNGDEESRIMKYFNIIQDFVVVLLRCSSVPTDSFNILGIIYGKLLQLCCPNSTNLADACVGTVSKFEGELSEFSPLAGLYIVQGIVAALNMDILTRQISLLSPVDSSMSISPILYCWRYNLRINMSAADPIVRCATIKGLSTIVSRWKQHRTTLPTEDGSLNNGSMPPSNCGSLKDADLKSQERALIQETLKVIFDSWENPPLRKLGMAIPALFRTLVQLLPPQQIQNLCDEVLKQPVNRKGRYLALEILLPYVPHMIPGSSANAHTDEEASPTVVPAESLLEGIGDRGPNAGAIADLWSKILSLIWKELEEDKVKHHSSDNDSLFVLWASYWVPYLSRALLAPNLIRRKQVAAFCLPRIVDFMREVECLKPLVSRMFAALMTAVETTDERHRNGILDGLDQGRPDRILWAQLELCRHSLLLKASGDEIKSAVAGSLVSVHIKSALTHQLPSIRIVAYQALERVMFSYDGRHDLEAEATMWMHALPYSMTTDENSEDLSSLLQSLTHFLDRLSQWEARTTSQEALDSSILRSFAIDFLINDLVVTRGAYPGTVANKETFCLSMLDSLLAYVLQDERFSGDVSLSRNGPIFKRKRRAEELEAMDDILAALLSKEVFLSLLGLMHSIWESTRTSAFQFLCKSVIACQLKNLVIPEGFNGSGSRMRRFLTRGIYLASSPRQREADTGARMLAFMYATLPIGGERESFFADLVKITRDRVTLMRDSLRSILSGHSTSSAEIEGSDLPLAHGLVHASRLCIGHDAMARKLGIVDTEASSGKVHVEMTEIFCRALQLSLSIVSDIREGEMVDGIDEDVFLASQLESNKDSTPLNVNTGAIGANGTFSSVARKSGEESKFRLSMQRIVIGTWLLTKETCAAIAAIVTMSGYQSTQETICKVGQLLLSTLTTVKHAGAAFAARDSLQHIATACLSQRNVNNFYVFPAEWMSRLLNEISLNERVRNSTLRRSTGYALGFLAIMRAEVGSKSGSQVISKAALWTILKLSLPPKLQLKEALELLNIKGESSVTSMFVYASSTMAPEESCVADCQYESRCRVHALNILRMIILDAPLTSVISPFIGDGIISSILGYNDSLWAIRNSSTMVFAAAMLRVVDADKNASNSDKTSNNAITLSELFRRYPQLEVFIPAVLRKCLDGMESEGVAHSQMFPILLLLSRVQGMSNAGDFGTSIVDTLLPPLTRSLGSRDHSIRDAAARSISNLSTKFISSALLSQCMQLIEDEANKEKPDWNAIEGHLLAISSFDLGLCDESNSERRYLIHQLHSRLIDIVKKVRKPIFPPVSRSTALKILLSSSNPSDDIRSGCEHVIQDANVGATISGCLLLRTAAEGTCRSLQPKIWLANDESYLEDNLARLRELFTSSLVDVRVVAVKCFKKEIYENVDQLEKRYKEGDASEHDCLLPPKTIRNRLAGTLLECTASELRRDETEPNMGAHVPTIRRLSRCFLEVAGCLRAISKDFLSPDDCSLLWTTSFSMTERESYLFEGCEESNGGSVISSNAVEMMAYAITNGWDNVGGSIEINIARLAILMKIVKRLNTPHASWRSRYSAALSLETCSELWKVGSTVPEGMKAIRADVLVHILALLQDSDPDVRAVAVRAATKFCNFSHDSTSLLPEWTLERSFPLAFAVAGKDVDVVSEMSRFLLQLVIDNCSGILKSVHELINEYNHIYSAASGDEIDYTTTLVNVNTARQIFEDEDPNPFREKMFLNQLATRSLWATASIASSSSTQGLTSTNILAKRMLDICLEVLNLLVQDNRPEGLVQDISRTPSMFPSLHGILSVTYTCISGMTENSLGIDNVREVRYLAGQLASQDEFLHPEILRALHALLEPSPGRESTMLELTFLLKNNADTV